jgi:hypothetical protein
MQSPVLVMPCGMQPLQRTCISSLKRYVVLPCPLVSGWQYRCFYQQYQSSHLPFTVDKLKYRTFSKCVLLLCLVPRSCPASEPVSSSLCQRQSPSPRAGAAASQRPSTARAWCTAWQV